MATHVTPFDGAPITREVTGDDGRPELHITACPPTPASVRYGDIMGTVHALFWAGIGLYSLPRQDYPLLGGALFVAGPLLAHGWLCRLFADELAVTTHIRFTEDSFSMKRGKEDWQVFDRRHPHRFVLLPHDRAQEEKDRHEYEKAKASIGRRAVMPRRYYTNAFHVVFEYLGQRHDILEVHGPKEAQAILTRLLTCDSLMEAQANKGKGVPLTPADEWGPQPGDIPAHP
jgi:hypothetical protein